MLVKSTLEVNRTKHFFSLTYVFTIFVVKQGHYKIKFVFYFTNKNHPFSKNWEMCKIEAWNDWLQMSIPTIFYYQVFFCTEVLREAFLYLCTVRIFWLYEWAKKSAYEILIKLTTIYLQGHSSCKQGTKDWVNFHQYLFKQEFSNCVMLETFVFLMAPCMKNAKLHFVSNWPVSKTFSLITLSVLW